MKIKPKKINLKSIRIKSFITTIDSGAFRTIKGGTSVVDEDTNIYTDNCGLDTHETDPTTSTHTGTRAETAGPGCQNNNSVSPCNIG